MAAVAVPPVETEWHEMFAVQHQGDEVALLEKLRPAVDAATGVAGDRDSHKAAVLNAGVAEHVRPPASDARHAMIRASAHDSSVVDGIATVNGDVARSNV